MSYYESIYEISKKETSDKLRKKVNNPQGYSQEAVDAAKKILEEREEYPGKKEEKMHYREHDYLAEMARDVHTIKNIIVFCFVLGVIGVVLMMLGM